MKMCQNFEWPQRLVLPDAFCELHTFVPPKKRRQQNFFVPDIETLMMTTLMMITLMITLIGDYTANPIVQLFPDAISIGKLRQ